MTKLYLPFAPRPDDPQGHMVVERNLEEVVKQVEPLIGLSGAIPTGIPIFIPQSSIGDATPTSEFSPSNIIIALNSFYVPAPFTPTSVSVLYLPRAVNLSSGELGIYDETFNLLWHSGVFAYPLTVGPLQFITKSISIGTPSTLTLPAGMYRVAGTTYDPSGVGGAGQGTLRGGTTDACPPGIAYKTSTGSYANLPSTISSGVLTDLAAGASNRTFSFIVR